MDTFFQGGSGMVLTQMVVDAVVLEGRSMREVAQAFGVSKSWVHKKVQRYRLEGPCGLEPRSRAPRRNPNQMSLEVENRVIELRKELSDLGADSGPQTIAVHLSSRWGQSASVSSIYRALKRRGFITEEPKKRPKASYIRFEADLPNECWQGDMTHWALSDGTGVEIVNFIDDYSRLVVCAEVVVVTKSSDVRRIFRNACALWGTPASVLTDNGAIFNARSRGGRTGFESDLVEAGVLYKHSRPYHPQTCGKVERWHQTLKQFLAKKPCRDLEELQQALNEIVVYYNEQRPHRSRDRMTPLAAFNARPRGEPFTLLNQPHHRIRRDVVDNSGKVTVRYLGAMRHLKVGNAYRGQRVRLYLVDAEVRIVTEDGELIRVATLDASKNYQPTRKPQME